MDPGRREVCELLTTDQIFAIVWARFTNLQLTSEILSILSAFSGALSVLSVLYDRIDFALCRLVSSKNARHGTDRRRRLHSQQFHETRQWLPTLHQSIVRSEYFDKETPESSPDVKRVFLLRGGAQYTALASVPTFKSR